MKLLEITKQRPKIYLVGGAVRDQLLGRPIKDKDYVVVGATPEYMEKHGFSRVGADFPVFLHPKTKEEYALARTERKTGTGYHGFETTFDPSVTIEDDLARRDLTANAIGYDLETGEYIDPFGGRRDLQAKTLRHVGKAFAEDPVRVLRVARFRARYGFKVAPETIQLMKQLNDELSSLTKERVWLEIEKTMSESHPDLFFDTLRKSDSLQVLFPELRFTDRVARLLRKTDVSFAQRIALLLADTPSQDAETFVQRWKAPNDVRQIVIPFKNIQEKLKKAPKIDGTRAVTLIQMMDGWRQPERARTILDTLRIEGTNVTHLHKAFEAAQGVTFQNLAPEQQQALKGAEIGEAIHKLRVAAAQDATR